MNTFLKYFLYILFSVTVVMIVLMVKRDYAEAVRSDRAMMYSHETYQLWSKVHPSVSITYDEWLRAKQLRVIKLYE